MSGDRPIDRVLARLPGARPCGAGFTAPCPAHDDGDYRLSVAEAEDGKVLLHCFGGCGPERVAAALGLELADLFPRDDGRPGLRPSAEPPSADGCSLAAYAEAKRLPEPFLRGLGLHEAQWRDPDRTVLVIPYPREDGRSTKRYRLLLEKGDGPGGSPLRLATGGPARPLRAGPPGRGDRPRLRHRRRGRERRADALVPRGASGRPAGCRSVPKTH